MFETRLARRIFKGFAVLAMVCALGAGALLGSLWLEHRTELTLPTPTGSFAVGRAIHDWADDLHLDTLAPVPGTKRELLIWIWYPAAPGKSVVPDDYVPPQLQARGTPTGSPILRFLTRDPSKVHSSGKVCSLAHSRTEKYRTDSSSSRSIFSPPGTP